MLRRAGYIRADGELTPLGRRARARLEELAQGGPAAGFVAALTLPSVHTADDGYYYPLPAGRVSLLRCPACGYVARRAVAAFAKPIPAGESPALLEKVRTPESNTIEALAAFLDIPRSKTAKALMYTRLSDRHFVFVVIRGDMQLSEEKLTTQVGAVEPATREEIRAAGAAPGYASPIGLRRGIVVVDDLIPGSPNLVAGANESGFHLKNTNYGRDYRADIVADLALAEPGAACPSCSTPMELLHADLLAGASGYDLDAALEALADAHHDNQGLTLPAAAAPFDVYLLHLPGGGLDTRGQAARLHDEWSASGVRVLLDDRDERAGVKFADADLIGCPMRATVGERGMKDGMVELKARTGGESLRVPFEDALAHLRFTDKAS